MKCSLVVFLILFCILNSFAGEKGNGGPGVLCYDSLYTLDFYEYYGQQKAEDKVIHSSHFNKELEKRFELLDKKLRQNIKKAMLVVGDEKSWSRGPMNRTFDSHYLAYELEEGCELIQLVQMKDDKVSWNIQYYDELRAIQKKIMWLHEVIYYTGRTYYGHQHSFLARALTIELIKKIISSDDLGQVLKIFVNQRNFLNRLNKATIDGTIFKLQNSNYAHVSCPERIGMDRLSFYHYIFYFQGHSSLDWKEFLNGSNNGYYVFHSASLDGYNNINARQRQYFQEKYIHKLLAKSENKGEILYFNGYNNYIFLSSFVEKNPLALYLKELEKPFPYWGKAGEYSLYIERISEELKNKLIENKYETITTYHFDSSGSLRASKLEEELTDSIVKNGTKCSYKKEENIAIRDLVEKIELSN